jgi:transglutaminase/protease-like cytokinesis protein 3
MYMRPVHSSAIEAIGYDAITKRLRIRFTGGREYDFCDVPQRLYERFMAARSHGDFYNLHIRDRYSCG